MSHETLHAGIWTFLHIYKTVLQRQGQPLPSEQEFMQDGLSKWKDLSPYIQDQFSTNAEPFYEEYRQRLELAPDSVFHAFGQPAQPNDVVMKKARQRKSTNNDNNRQHPLELVARSPAIVEDSHVPIGARQDITIQSPTVSSWALTESQGYPAPLAQPSALGVFGGYNAEMGDPGPRAQGFVHNGNHSNIVGFSTDINGSVNRGVPHDLALASHSSPTLQASRGCTASAMPHTPAYPPSQGNLIGRRSAAPGGPVRPPSFFPYSGYKSYADEGSDCLSSVYNDIKRS